ncbi:MAG: DNA-formamidopyrimidine glycosylase family protein [Verrucomicrobiota bacterium]
MPELAEVEYYRKRWAGAEGSLVDSVEVNAKKRVYRDADPQALVRGLEGSTLGGSSTYGKQMSFAFGSQHWLGVHLGMAGRLKSVAADYQKTKHDHLLIRLETGEALVFSDPRLFGKLLYHEGKSPPWLENLSPEILSDEFTLGFMNTFLDRRARSPIKAVLLMQERFPGIGNWMADEILWRARIAPNTRSGMLDVAQRRELYKRIREVSGDAMRVIGTNWSRPPNSWLFNHRWKDGGFCPQTGEPLEREVIGGRTTCWSPSWQK